MVLPCKPQFQLESFSFYEVLNEIQSYRMYHYFLLRQFMDQVWVGFPLSKSKPIYIIKLKPTWSPLSVLS